ncbi:MAG: Ig-like domain-containing protein [Clostridia bacterium]|nr:Ig-like domain-containing protein [Clostridia bacterium]
MKKQIKKSMSLFLAVLMLLSSWVWFAPEKAEAATTQYYVKFTSNVTNTGDENSGTKLTIDWKDTNGTSGGSTGSKVVTFSQQGWDGQTTIWEGMIDGFPTKVTFNMFLDSTRKERHENFCLYVGSSAETCTTNVITSDNYGFSGSANTFSKSVNSSAYPKFTTVSSVAGIEAGTLNKLANGATITKTAAINGAKDQYGVAWVGSLPTSGFSYALKNAEGGAISSTYASVSGTGSTATVKLNDDLQKLFPNTKSGTIYLHATYGGTTVTSNVKFDNPEYTMTFHANGGKIGADDSSATDTVTMGGTDSKMFYDSVIGKSPAYRVKDGYEFKGFYSTKNADAAGRTASFSGTEFKDGETKVDANGDKTWYAAWQARPLTATFVTADNQLIGTLEGRYNNNLAATNMYNGLSGVNAALKAAYDANGGKGVTWNGSNEPVYTDGSNTYTFSHWRIIKAYNDSVVDGDEKTNLQGDVTFQAVYTKADAAKYSVKFYDGNGNVINDASNKSDYSFRDDVILPSTEPTKAQDDKYEYEFIGWAKNIGKNFYAVDENNQDENGAVISYTAKEAAEFTVRGDASYVPVFRTIPREYSVTFNYKVDGGATESVTVDGYHWLDGVSMPEEIKDNYTSGGYRYYIDGWKVGSNATKKQLDDISVNGNLTLTATYGAGKPAVYTINFYDKDGNHLNAGSNQYSHNSVVTAPEVEQTIDTDDSLYTFVAFKDANGNTYAQTATGDAEYTAEYTKKDYADISFYNYDGTLIYSLDGKENSIFVGDKVPVYDEEAYKLPERATDPVGSYNFTGWADSLGNEVIPGTDSLTGDTYLYAQFETVYKNYTVKFLNDDGTEYSVGPYHYGDPVAIPEENPTKAADETYTYSFRAWDPEVEEVCYKDATYTATYRRSYNYYKVTWLNDSKQVATAANYIYNEKIQQAPTPVPTQLGSANEGYSYVIDQWIRCDKNGNAILDGEGNQIVYHRGDRMPAEELYFYPTYKQQANTYTVEFYNEDGSKLLGKETLPHDAVIYKAGVEYADDAVVYGETYVTQSSKAATETHHYDFTHWRNSVSNAEVTTITENCKLYATFTEEEHNKVLYEIVKAPTCTETGLGNYKCESESCGLIDYDVVLDVIPDDSAPNGQIYIGRSKWTLNDYRDGNIDFDSVVYVGPKTNVIINTEDLGTRSMPWNLEGQLSRGVGKIEYYISTEKLDDASSITNWTTAYDYDQVYSEVLAEEILNAGLTKAQYEALADTDAKKKAVLAATAEAISAYQANTTGILENLNLVNGEEYIIYAKISDREFTIGEEDYAANVSYMSTGWFHYGSTAPTVTISGDGTGTKFCAEATIEVTDDLEGFVTLVDGEEVTLTDGKYTTTEKGVHTVSVTDKNGNITTKSFEIKGSHTYRNYTIAATCENAGSRYDLCTLCGVKANTEVIAATGHNFSSYIEKAPSCVDDGYRLYSCANGCGETLNIKWNSSADELAKAKKFVEGEGEAEDEWVSITAEDVKHLKATGTHTYAKAVDEKGNETAEDAWVIDKAATCNATGSKHKDCVICGERVTEEIPVDSNAHKFYRAKVAQEPTCTEQGWKNATCKYCGFVKVKAEMIPALGHTEGEYRIIKEANCLEKGEKVLTCEVCGIDIGEADKDGNYNTEKPVTVEIDALGHLLVFDRIVEPTVDDEGNPVQGYSLYKCARADCDYTEKKDYFDKVEEFTVNFVDGDTTVYTTTQAKLSTITADLVTEPTKAQDATYKYTFKNWASRTGEGTEESPYVYTAVKFPIEVKENITYYAQYEEKFINYTITYYEEDGVTQYKKVGYLHNGETYELPEGPSKAQTVLNTYTFAGWKLLSGDKVYNDTIKIEGANLSLKATYTETKRQYAVTYAYSKSDILETFLVEAGTSARDCYLVPVKEADTKYHYDFDEWNKAAQLENVESNIYTTPNFTPAEHQLKTRVVSPANCLEDAVVEKYCDCGYKYTTTGEKALGHLWGEAVYNEETGKSIVSCTREGCDVSQEDTRKFTVKFFLSEDATDAFKTINYIPWGSTVSGKLPGDPIKESTSTYEYKFEGWAIYVPTYTEDGDAIVDTEGNPIMELKVVDPANQLIKADTNFYAVFKETVRKYTVIFAYNATEVIKVYNDVLAGSSVVYDGAVPTKDFDATYHYSFKGWNADTSDVQSDMKVYAEFNKAKHSYTESSLGEATCTNGKGTRYTCSCGKYYDVTGKPLDHEYVQTERVEPAAGKDGYVKYDCKNCDATYTETLKWVDDTILYTITVKDQDGDAVGGATVQAYLDGVITQEEKTNANGQATFLLKKGKTYTFKVYGDMIENGVDTTIKVDADGNVTGSIPAVSVSHCSCTCHRDGLWAVVFRWFHKIIKSIVGEFKCCNDPDAKYYS